MHGKRVRAGSPPPSAVDGPCRAPRPASSAPLLQTAPKCSPFQQTAPVCDPLVHRAPLCKHRAQALWAPVTSSPTSAPWVVSSLLCAVGAFLAAPLLPTWAPPRPLRAPCCGFSGFHGQERRPVCTCPALTRVHTVFQPRCLCCGFTCNTQGGDGGEGGGGLPSFSRELC